MIWKRSAGRPRRTYRPCRGTKGLSASSKTAVSTTPAARRGSISLARHGEPALSRKVRLNATEYRKFWATYEVGSIRADQAPPSAILEVAGGADVLFSSTRIRAIETATLVAGGRPFITDEVFIEAPLPPPHFPAWFKLPPKYWGAVARFWWHVFNHHEGQETRREAEARSETAARALIARAESGQDVLVLAHGYFNHMVGRRLRADGWSLVHNQGFKYWSQRRYEKR